MAHETVDYQDRIIRDPAILVGKPVVRGTRIPVELVLAKLAANPDLGELFEDYPELTREDLQAVLAYARDHLAGEQPSTPTVQSPQDFYAQFTRRPDVAEIMRRLAK